MINRRHRQPKRPALNAISSSRPDIPANERTERHLRQCQRLAELGMQVAEAAAAQTLAELAVPEPPSDTAVTDAPATKPQPRRQTDAGLVFTRVSRAVRQAMALEARIAAGAFAYRQRFRSADPRHAPLRQAFRDATANHPDRAELRREADERLDIELAFDPDGEAPVSELLAAIAEDLGITLDFAKLPDELVDIAPAHWPGRATAPVPPWMAAIAPQGAGPPPPN